MTVGSAPRSSRSRSVAPRRLPGVVLVELKRAEGAGLEEMFLQLTSDDARDSITAEGVQA